jgi:serine/threonine protein kinase
MGGQIPTKGDVYSYGVLLLEMFTGKCPTDETFRDGMSLHNHVAAESRHGIAKILDPIMLQNDLGGGYSDEMVQSCALPMLKLGLLCSMASPRDRLGMAQVCTAIHDIKHAFFEFCSGEKQV